MRTSNFSITSDKAQRFDCNGVEDRVPGDFDHDSLKRWFYLVRTKKETYASLFNRLCSVCGLTSRVVRGYVKGNGYYPGYEFNTDRQAEPLTSSWNVVNIDGCDKIIDTQWGSRIVSSREGTFTVYFYLI